MDGAKPNLTTTLTRDVRRRVTSIESEFDTTGKRTWDIARDGLGNPTQLTSPEGRIVVADVDERGYLLDLTTGSTNALATRFSYHPSGALKEVKNPLGQITSFGEDGFGRTNQVTAPTGEKLKRVMDKLGRTTSTELRDAVNVLHANARATHDVRNRPTSTILERFNHGAPAEDLIHNYEYNVLSQVSRVTTPLGLSYSYTYYSCGRPRTIKNDQTNGEIEYIYDTSGLLVEVKRTESEGGTTKVYKSEISYDAEGRVTEEREIDANDGTHVVTTTYAYDSLGRLREVVGPTGIKTRYFYNYAGYLVKMEEIERLSGGGTTTHSTNYAWDKDGNLLSVTDATGSKTQYEYDEHGRLTKITQPDTTTRTFVYDGASRVVTETDNNGTVVTNVYDASGKLTSRTIAPATGVIGTTSETYTYDSVGRLISAADNDSVVQFVYDSVGNILQEKQGPNATALNTVASTFDKEGFLAALTRPGGLTTARTRDAAGRLSTIAQGSLTIAERTYVQTSSLAAQKTLGAVAAQEFSYDGFARWAAWISTKTPGGGSPTTLYNVDYGYDDAFRRLYERRLHSANVGELFSYNDLGQTTRVLRGVADPKLELQTPGSQTFVTKVDYTLSAVGNRSQVKTTPSGGTATTVAYTSNNQHEYTAVGGVSRTHDATGNLTGNGTYTFKYNYRNQLVEVRAASGGALVATYQYDVFGRRTAKLLPTSTARFYYDGDDLVEIRDGAGVTTHAFVYGDHVDDVVGVHYRDVSDYDSDGNTTEYLWFAYHRDAINSVRVITDSSGNVAEQYQYDEYGNATIRDGAGGTLASSGISNPFRFTGREFDAETGLMYYRARYYDVGTGSFLQRDPLGFVDGFNLYEYVRSAPMMFVDPFGLEGDSAWSKFTGGMRAYGRGLKRGAKLFGSSLVESAKPRLPRTVKDLVSRDPVGGTLVGAVDSAGYANALVGQVANASTPEEVVEVVGEGVAVVAAAALLKKLTGKALCRRSGPAPTSSSTAAPAPRPRTNKVTPVEGAGAHTGFKRNPVTGEVSGYTTFDDLGRAISRFKMEGRPHGGVTPPIVYGPKPGKGPGAPLNRARPARPDETPRRRQ